MNVKNSNPEGGVVVNEGQKFRNDFIARLQERVDKLNELKPKFDKAMIEVGAELDVDVLKKGHSVWTSKVDQYFKRQTRGKGLTNELVDKYYKVGLDLMNDFQKINLKIISPPMGLVSVVDYIELKDGRFRAIVPDVSKFEVVLPAYVIESFQTMCNSHNLLLEYFGPSQFMAMKFRLTDKHGRLDFDGVNALFSGRNEG